MSGLNQSSPKVAADNNDDFIFTWWDDRNDGYGCRIFLQKLSENGELTGNNFQTTNDETVLVSTMEGSPSIIVESNGDFLVFWYDKRDESAIYVQKYTNTGAPIDTNIKLDQALSTNMVKNDDHILIIGNALTDDQTTQIFGQTCTFDGALSDNTFQISDDSTIVKYSAPAVSKLGSDNFVIAWQDQRHGAYDIYARRINESGVVLDSSFKVNDDIGSDSDPCVASNESGNFLIAWTDQSHENNSAIYAQLFTPEGVAINSNFKVSTNTGGEILRNTAVTAIGDGNFVFAWTDYTNKNIYAQIVSGDGALIDTNFQVGVSRGNQWNPPAIESDETGNFIIAWTDNRNQNWPDDPWEVFAQRYISDGTPLEDVFKISNNNNLPSERTPDVKLFNNRIYTTWAETDRFDLGTGIDIWANVLDWNEPIGTDIENTVLMPLKFSLDQNFPNPFNPVTTIRYSVGAGISMVKTPGMASLPVELSIYNLLGQKVTTLVSDYQSPGQYKVQWDAREFASGLYFYQLSAGHFTQTRRMLLLK